MSSYNTLQEADTYFQTRLFSQKWFNKSIGDRTAALLAASEQIDRLCYIGLKHAAWVQAQATPPTNRLNEDAIVAAGLTQAREFPRGSDTAVPTNIKKAECEIAYELLVNERDPAQEYENLNVNSEGYASVRRSYSNSIPEHLIAGIVSVLAWRYLKPYLRDGLNVTLKRV